MLPPWCADWSDSLGLVDRCLRGVFPYPRRRGRPLDPRRLWVWGRRVGGGSESAAAVANCDRVPDRSNRNCGVCTEPEPKGGRARPPLPPLAPSAAAAASTWGKGDGDRTPRVLGELGGCDAYVPPSQGQGRQIHRAARAQERALDRPRTLEKEGRNERGVRGGRGEAAASGALSRAVHVARSSFAGREDYQVRTYSTPIPNARSIGARRIASGFDRSGP